MTHELDLDDETIDRIERHRTTMQREIPDEHVIRNILDKARRYERLKGALRRGDDYVRHADNGNVVVEDNGENLVVLRPQDAAALASGLNLAAHGEEK
jgi:hypothetical protein